MPDMPSPTDEVPNQVLEELDRGAALYDEFSTNMLALSKAGAVDFKMAVFAGRETTTASVVAVTNNVLRLLAAGKGEPLILG